MYEYELRRRDNIAIIDFAYGLNEKDMWKKNPQFNSKEWLIFRFDYIG